MSVINPNETARSWKAGKHEAAVKLYLSEVEGNSAELVGARVSDVPLSVCIVAPDETIAPDELVGAIAAVVQVDAERPGSVKRFERLAQATSTPLIAAAYEPPLALVRSLVRAGAHDVIPLPVKLEDLETSVAPLRDQHRARLAGAQAANGKVVSIVKSVGGVGATALISQLAIRLATDERARGRDVCLIDLDVQFGDAAFQLGLEPRLSLLDLLEAGSRLDGDLLRATTVEHPSGLKVIASPPEMMPLEGVAGDHIAEIAELATREFDTVFVDLPTNWTNWSLSMVARSDLVLLVTELSVASLNRAKRQLDLIASQDLGELDVRIVVNRFEKNLLRTIRPADVRQALGRDVSYRVGNDFALMSAAIDRGVPLGEIKRKSALAKDLDELSGDIAAVLGLER